MNAFLYKLKNWWWYNRLYVLIGIAAAAVLIYSFVPAGNHEAADYHVAVVTSLPLSGDEQSALTARLSSLGEDLNGDGEISVLLHPYAVDLENPSPTGANENYQLVAALDADLVGKISGLFILDAPELFQRVTNGILDETIFPCDESLYAAVRKDADPAYFRLMEKLG